MKPFCATLLAWVALTAPAWGAEATLEGYGGDGALLVGIDSKDSPFSNRGGGGGGVAGGDGNLVAESGPAPAPAAGSGTSQGETAPAPTAGEETSEAGGQALQRGESQAPRGSERGERADGGGRPGQELGGTAPAAEQPQPVAEGEPAGAGGTLPFTGLELALLLAAALGLVAVGFAMRRLALRQAQPF